jgi:hypothetical protein
MSHTFHIPVLGLGYSIDTPLKVARYGISSVISIVDDQLIERMRALHLRQNNLPYIPITDKEADYRAKRITAYLNLLNDLINEQAGNLKDQPFSPGSDITRYFELLPEESVNRKSYLRMLAENGEKKLVMQKTLRAVLKKGSIDVNIMAKVDKINYSRNGMPLDEKFSDALAALRGFANSNLNSSIVLSAGLNPRLYSYMEEFEDFFPVDQYPAPKKKIILKVSDFRSAFIQAKFLAKKGLWVHEFRIESGLNCGGHAFATEGFLLGPILEEFKEKKQSMISELFESYKSGLKEKGIQVISEPASRIAVQGGIGTAEENDFLKRYYQLDGTGWGSPFLLVPETTNVDESTLQLLADAGQDDFYISGSSPLGIPFNNFRKSSSEIQRLDRIAKGRPGSPCTKKYLISNTEFTDEPICTASREYQKLKLEQLHEQELPEQEYQEQYQRITEKLCLCQGLSTAAYIKNNILKPREDKAVTICPGPNLAYFSGTYSLEDMIKHIYGKINLLEGAVRPHVFINELKLYIDYLKNDIEINLRHLSDKKIKQLERFKEQLLNGIEYYKALMPELKKYSGFVTEAFNRDIERFQMTINQLQLSRPQNPE